MATKEAAIKYILDQVEEEFSNLCIASAWYKDSESVILKNIEDDMALLQENILKLESISSSQYAKVFKEKSETQITNIRYVISFL